MNWATGFCSAHATPRLQCRTCNPALDAAVARAEAAEMKLARITAHFTESSPEWDALDDEMEEQLRTELRAELKAEQGQTDGETTDLRAKLAAAETREGQQRTALVNEGCRCRVAESDNAALLLLARAEIDSVEQMKAWEVALSAPHPGDALLTAVRKIAEKHHDKCASLWTTLSDVRSPCSCGHEALRPFAGKPT